MIIWLVMSLLLDNKLKTKALSGNIWSGFTMVFSAPNKVPEICGLSTNNMGKEWIYVNPSPTLLLCTKLKSTLTFYLL